MARSEFKKVAWNTSSGLVCELANKRSNANNLFISGNIKRAMNTLIALKQSTIQSFTKEEREALSKIEKRFNRVSMYLSASISASFNPNLREAFMLATQHARNIYSEYNETLMDILNKYGYLIDEKSDGTRMNF